MSSLADQIFHAGVVGAGGAGFPTHVKAQSRVEICLANGAECEPLLYSDQYIMKTHAREILAGLKLMMNATGALKGILALKAEYKDEVAALLPQLAKYPDIELCYLGSVYPSGDEQTMVYEATGRVVPEGGIPLAVGVAVSNVETLLNVFNASRGQSLTTRTVTMNGEVRRPGVYRFPVGTSFKDAVAAAGGSSIPEDELAVVDGGPMMGAVKYGLGHYIKKTTGGLILLHREHPYVRRRTMPDVRETKISISACCQCRACTDLCPRYQLGHELEPHKVMRAIQNRRQDPPSQITQAFLCCECGVCEIVACPLFLSPRNIFAQVKCQLRAKGLTNPHRLRPDRVRDSYEFTKIPKMRSLARTGLMSYYKHLDFLEPLNLISKVRILCSQNVGSPAIPCVEVGQRVNCGELVARAPEGALGANHHASISGVVMAVNPDFVEIEG